MALSSDQLSDFQADLGISTDQSVFTDTQLNRLYERAGSNYNKAVMFAIRQILMDAAKFNDYVAGQTHENKSQIFMQLKDMYAIYQAAVRAGNQVRITGIRPVPPPVVDSPADGEPADEKARRHADYPYRLSRRRY